MFSLNSILPVLPMTSVLVHWKYNSVGQRGQYLRREERGIGVQFCWLWFLYVASEFCLVKPKAFLSV